MSNVVSHIGDFVMDKKTEYEALRAEILLSLQTVKNYRTFLYSAVAALLAFAFEKENPFMFLIPFVVIIPLHLLSMHQIDSALRIGSYIYVFLENGEEVHWETRLLEYDKLHKGQYDTKKANIDPYWYLSLLCLTFSVVNVDFEEKNFYLMLILPVAILILCLYLFFKKRPDYSKRKIYYINEWEKIKQNENK